MYNDLHQLSRNIVSKYSRSETLENCKSASMLCYVNFSDTKNHLKNKEMNIGFGANRILTDKVRIDEITKREFDVFTAG